jgi:NADPH:quinone reductase-like Zn-dependent oxidoreductase
MKAAQISSYGDASVIEINEAEKPALKNGQVLVEVHAASLNPFDSKLRFGYMKDFIPLQFPFTLGGDIAGVVTEVTPEVTGLAVGDKIYGQAASVAGNSGAFAEFAAVKTTGIAKTPQNIDFTEAASLPLVGSSAIQAIMQHINLQPGQKLFIHGGAGGIGTIAIQIAKHIGAYVAATATGEGIDTVKNLGADEAIDYKENDFSEMLSGYDAVFDTVGGDDFIKAFAILKKGGVAVSMGGSNDKTRANELGITVINQSTGVKTETLNILTELVENGVVKPNVGKVFSLEDTKEAFEALEAGSVGKIVLQVA